MVCIEWKEKLMDYIVKELPPQEARELELHIERCANCAGALNEYKDLRQMMKQHFTDLDMPSHLVLLPERPVGAPWRFFANPWAAGALGGALAAVFIAGLFFGGFARRNPAPLVHEQVADVVSRADVEAMVAREVSAKMTQQKAEFQTENEQLAESLRQEQARNLAKVAHQMQGLELAQDVVWKQTQQQNEFVDYLARNYLQPTSTPTGGSRR